MNAMDKVDLFRTIVRRFGGQCDLNNISDTETQYKVQDLLFNSADTWFRVEGRVISVYLPGLGICEEYSEGQPCTKRECNDIHLCTGLVLGSCEKGAKCKLFHRLKNEHNSNVIQKFPALTEDDILLYLQVILKQKVERKSEPKGTNLELEGTTVEPEGTNVGPERASMEQIKSGKAKESSRRTRSRSRRRQQKLKKVSAKKERDVSKCAVENRKDVTDAHDDVIDARDEYVDDVNAAVRISEENSSVGNEQMVPRETWKDLLSSNVGVNKETYVEIKVLQEHIETTGVCSSVEGRQPVVKSLEEERIITMTCDSSTTPVRQQLGQRIIHRLNALKFLLKQERGVCGLTEFTEGVGFTAPEATIQATFPVDLTTSESLELLNKPSVQKYMTLLSLGGGVMVVAMVKGLDLCFDYKSAQGCHNNRCPFIHLCKQFVVGCCPLFNQCKYSHNVTDPHNCRVLSSVIVLRLMYLCNYLNII